METIQSAVTLHQQGKTIEAKIIFEGILKNNPNEIGCLNGLGIIEASLGNFDSAIECFNKVLLLIQNDPTVLIRLATCYQLIGKNSESEEAYVQALELDPNNVQALRGYSLLLKQIGKLDEARPIFERALQITPNDISLLNNFGSLQGELGDLVKGRELLSRALALDSENPAILNNIAGIYSEQLDYQQAMSHYKKALVLNPNHILALNGLGNVYREIGDWKSASQQFQKAADIDRSSLISLSNLAGVIIAGDVDDAQKIKSGNDALHAYLKNNSTLGSTSFSFFAFKHHYEQAQFLFTHGCEVSGLESFLKVSSKIYQDAAQQGVNSIAVGANDYAMMNKYFGAQHTYKLPKNIPYGLNPDNNWIEIQERYLHVSGEIIYIDQLLTQEALDALYNYCLYSKVWIREYKNSYLGAFAYQGFISSLHLQIGREFIERMPLVFRDYKLSHLWAFKYDTSLGSGINVHADPAKVNVNFWVTPDKFHLNKEAGGLKVFTKKARDDWSFHQYNNSRDEIYRFLGGVDSESITVPYKSNRAVIFNSTLFHETDQINFVDQYEARRINMTYLFGEK